MSAAHRRQKPREETEARLLRERGTPEERIGPVVPDGALYPQPESSAASRRFQRRIFWIRNGWHWGWMGGTWRVLELGKVRLWL